MKHLTPINTKAERIDEHFAKPEGDVVALENPIEAAKKAKKL